MQISSPVSSILHHRVHGAPFPISSPCRMMVIEDSHDDVHLLDIACQTLRLPCALEC
jgi:hypothetical protein